MHFAFLRSNEAWARLVLLLCLGKGILANPVNNAAQEGTSKQERSYHAAPNSPPQAPGTTLCYTSMVTTKPTIWRTTYYEMLLTRTVSQTSTITMFRTPPPVTYTVPVWSTTTTTITRATRIFYNTVTITPTTTVTASTTTIPTVSTATQTQIEYVNIATSSGFVPVQSSDPGVTWIPYAYAGSGRQKAQVGGTKSNSGSKYVSHVNQGSSVHLKNVTKRAIEQRGDLGPEFEARDRVKRNVTADSMSRNQNENNQNGNSQYGNNQNGVSRNSHFNLYNGDVRCYFIVVTSTRRIVTTTSTTSTVRPATVTTTVTLVVVRSTASTASTTSTIITTASNRAMTFTTTPIVYSYSTVTTTVASSTSTAYDACSTNNFANYYNKAHIAGYSLAVYGNIAAPSANSAQDCCVAAILDPQADTWYYSQTDNFCGVVEQSTCDGAYGQNDDGQLLYANDTTSPMYVGGNANCGRWTGVAST